MTHWLPSHTNEKRGNKETKILEDLREKTSGHVQKDSMARPSGIQRCSEQHQDDGCVARKVRLWNESSALTAGKPEVNRMERHEELTSNRKVGGQSAGSQLRRWSPAGTLTSCCLFLHFSWSKQRNIQLWWKRVPGLPNASCPHLQNTVFSWVLFYLYFWKFFLACDHLFHWKFPRVEKNLLTGTSL